MDETPQPIETRPEPPEVREDKTRSSRLGRVWVSLAVFVIILIALLIFVAQNSMTVEIHYLGMKTKIGFGVAMLLSAAAGIVLTLLVGSARIIQLKVMNRNER